MAEVKAAGSAPGTSVEVRQIFFNLPARRKFLRTEETESAHTQHYLTLAALAYPEVAFTFHKDGRLVWQLPAIKSDSDATSRLSALRERMRAIYGGESKLLSVDFSAKMIDPDDAETGAEPGGKLFRVWGFIGAPGVSRSTREDQHAFVNRRPVENRGINFALLEGFHTALMKGRYPVCCLFLEIDPAAVDVNIHPAKREVKFHREGDVRRLVAQAVRETLLAFHANESVRRPAAPVHSPAFKVVEAAPAVTEPRQAALAGFPAAFRPPVLESPLTAAPEPALPLGFRRDAAIPSAAGPAAPLSTIPGASNSGDARLVSTSGRLEAARRLEPGESANPQLPVPLLHVPLRLVGVIGRLYVVLESDRGLVLLDQHAAHERILFEQMLNRLEQNHQAPSQRLLLPETVELSARDAQFLREQLAALTRLGVGLNEFGDRTFLLDALPPFVKVSDARRFVLELVDELKAAGQSVNTLRLGEHTVAKTVCRHAVKANDPLAGPELENLVNDLRHCAMPYTCPHGRPTLIEMNFRELEKKFGRTQ